MEYTSPWAWPFGMQRISKFIVQGLNGHTQPTDHKNKTVATFIPSRSNTTLAIFTLMVTYSMHVYILKMAVSLLCVVA